MADEDVVARVHGLSDLELAALLCLVSREHCLISTPEDAVDELIAELQLMPRGPLASLRRRRLPRTHNARGVCDVAARRLAPAPPSSSAARHHRDYFSRSPSSPRAAGPARVANVVLARHLDRAPRAVQVQALELLRTRRIYTRTAVQAAPAPFLLVAVVAAGDGEGGGASRLLPHLADFFYVAHWHDPDDGFANLATRRRGGGDDEDEEEEEEEGGGITWDAETASTDSVVRKPDAAPRPGGGGAGGGGGRGPVFSGADVAALAGAAAQVRVDVDVVRYQMNVVSFLRMHRAVAGGVTPKATEHLGRLMRCLAPLHRLDYVTPSLVAVAARKVYPHRIRIVAPQKERSMQWGSELAAIEAILDGVGPEDVIEDVLGEVPAPL